MTQFHLPNAQATHELGKQLGRSLPPHSILLLEGNLGAGKTTFVQGLAAGLDIPESIESPTFTLINEYDNNNDKTILPFELGFLLNFIINNISIIDNV